MTTAPIASSASVPSTKHWIQALVVAVIAVAFTGGLILVIGSGLIWFGWLPDFVGPDQKPISSGELASAVVAGATMLLAAVTALLALFTWEGLGLAQREVINTETGLELARREVANTETSLAAQRESLKSATDQARISQESLTASWRPLIAQIRTVESRAKERAGAYRVVTIIPNLKGLTSVTVGLMNIGRGPAFIVQALLGLGSAARQADVIYPTVVAPEDVVVLTFDLDTTTTTPETTVDKSIVNAVANGEGLRVSVSYHDIGVQNAWRSEGKLRPTSEAHTWEVSGVAIREAALIKTENPLSVRIQ